MEQSKYIYGIPALSEYIGKSERSIQRWLKNGKLEANKVGGMWAFERAAIDAFMKGETTDGQADSGTDSAGSKN